MSISGIQSSTFNPYQLGGTSNPLQQQLQQLGQALQSGNLSAAQSDFATLQQNFQRPNPPLLTNVVHGHHHHSRGGGSGDSSSQNSLLQDLNQIGQSLTSSNLAGAQQAYASLQQQLQQFALGGGALASLSPVSFDA